MRCGRTKVHVHEQSGKKMCQQAKQARGGRPGMRNESLHGRHCFLNTARLPMNAEF